MKILECEMAPVKKEGLQALDGLYQMIYLNNKNK